MKNSGFMMKPSPLKCGKCGEQRDLVVTTERKRIKMDTITSERVKVQCGRCGHAWWSRHRDALKSGAA